MKKTKKILSLVLCVILAVSLLACGSTGGTSSSNNSNQNDTVTLKLFAAWPEGNSNLVGMEEMIQNVSKKTNGSLIIEWGGGPEAIPAAQLAEAIASGVVDIAWSAHTYNISHMPVLEAIKLIEASVLRSGGGFDFVDQLYQDNLNAHYLGAICDGATYSFYLQREITTLDDFKGMTIRATPAYAAFVDALGAGQVNMAAGETYQALERGVIQGTGWPSLGIADFGWEEVVQYIIRPAFYNVDTALFISNQAWNRLSESQQQALKEAAYEHEVWAKSYYTDAIKKDNDMLVQGGMKIVELAPDIAERYLDLAYSAAWQSVLKADPENGKILQEFAGYGN